MEIRLFKLLCPKDHEVIQESGDFYCPQCKTFYDPEKLHKLPVDRSGFKPLDPPKVYGHLN